MNEHAFIDTAGWASLFIRTEPHHRAARATFDAWRRHDVALVTTNYVLTELVALFTSPLRIPRPRQVQYIETIKAAPYLQIVHIDFDLDRAAWTLLKTRLDKSWSLVDAASFVVMSQYSISEALTTDRHFEQAGFIRLLRE
jgi:uncharacterized protein